MTYRLLAILAVILSACSEPSPSKQAANADVIVIGAGIAGLSAALETARGGRSVLVVDMLSVPGGHAILSTGGLSIAGTPLQEKRGIKDSPDLAYGDFIRWGEDANEPWVRYYVDNSREQIYDWLIDLGATFTVATPTPGNSVARYHFIDGHGLGLIMPIYKAVLEQANIRFQLNTRADELIQEDGRIVGVKTTELRSGKKSELFAGAVLIATGGFQSNLDQVRANWRSDIAKPEQILAGSGWNSQGSGLTMARAVNANIERLDHQWNYTTGIPDPRFPGQDRGLSVLTIPPGGEVWVNTNGDRFINECSSPKKALPAIVDQPGDNHWMIFDNPGKRFFMVSGSGWTKERTKRLVLDNPDLIKQANTLEELASMIGVDAQRLQQSVASYNTLAAALKDKPNAKITATDGTLIGTCGNARQVLTPPFYAVQRFILARKSMGGIRIDLQARVLDQQGKTIPGLYAAGEASGFAGINGKAALEGTHLGPSLVTGRVAGRQMIKDLAAMPITPLAAKPTPEVNATLATTMQDTSNASCTDCHDLPKLIKLKRPGYHHFELAHRMVIDEEMSCSSCHNTLFPYNEQRHQFNLTQATAICTQCHGG